MKIYAVIDSTNTVINTIIWDGKASWSRPANCSTIQIPVDSAAGIGWTYVDGVFSPPVDPATEEPQP